MAENQPRRWVVLIQKSPRGPLTELEIKELIAKGLVRVNDLGYLAGEPGSETTLDWKFLWQFPEFDRRKPKPAEPGKPPVVDEWASKRKPMTEEQIRQKIAEALPPDLLDLRAEDLTPHATGPTALPLTSAATIERETTSLSESAPSSSPRRSPQEERHFFRYFAGVALIVAGVGLKKIPFKSLFNFKLPSATTSTTATNAPPPEEAQTSGRGRKNIQLAPVRSPAKTAAPSAQPRSRAQRMPVQPPPPPPPEEAPQESPGYIEPPPPPENNEANETPPPPPAEAQQSPPKNDQRPVAGEEGEQPEGAQMPFGPDANTYNPQNGPQNVPQAQPEEDEETKRQRDNFLGGGN